ncbi:hypothetical protein C8R43DRAFT_945096 [Mycena crocata]|nr:hypothetical protein C8R43DRAFT_945096 [Mycena crocata]
MQELPQPADQPIIDGCPVIELPDTIVDVEYLLMTLYTPALTWASTFLSEESLPFPAIAALICLGRKYDFKDLLDSAIKRLTFENPTTLKEYGARLNPDGSYQSTRITELFDAPERTSLIPIDQRNCIMGREKLLKTQSQEPEGYTFGWTRSPPSGGGCTDTILCTATREATLRHCSDNMNVIALNELRRESLCRACTRHMLASMASGRKKIWQELPNFFDLPPWAELTDCL